MAAHVRMFRVAAPVTAVALALAGLVAAGSPAAAEPGEPALQLVAPYTKQTLHRIKGEPVNLGQLATYAVAGGGPVEFSTGRDKYSDPVRTTVTIGSGNSRRTIELPAGTTKEVNQLTRFLTLVVRDSAGKKVWGKYLDFCPNSWTAARFRPGAPAHSPYPDYCGYHPFAIGSVLGVQNGWAVPVLGGDDFYGGSYLPMRRKNGKYTASVAIAPAYRKALGLTTAQASVSVAVTVAYGDPYEGMSLRRSATAPTPASTRPAASRTFATAAVAQGAAPDLRSLPAYGISLVPRTVKVNGKKVKRSYIDFGATVWNAGPSPLVVDGFRRPGEDLMDAYQYFFDAAGNQLGSAPAGTLEWDARRGHTHWHFTDFAKYSLLDADKKTAVRSGKEAFCLAATDPVDTRVPGANWHPAETDLSTACGGKSALALREVLDAGWGDTYDQSRPGQSLNITTLPKGIYYISVDANPEKKLAEVSTDNNRALRKVAIGGKPGGKRTLKVYPYQGVKD